MNKLGIFSVGAALVVSTVAIHAQTNAPTTDIADTYFTGVLSSSTGGANADGSFTDFFASNGQDYTVSAAGVFSAPVAYAFANTGANTATITEGTLIVGLTYTSATGGTFVANYGSGVTQSGTFTTNTTASEDPLGDVSCLTNVPAGGSATIGFYIGGSVPHSVLIRAVGPGLATFGVTGTLATPTVMLWSKGTVVSSGTSTTTALQSVYASSGAFNLPVGSADSVIQATLQPGAYTAQVTGGSSTANGQVLIEVYYLN